MEEMQIVVTKSSPVLVAPSEPGTPVQLCLSSLDRCLVRLAMTSLLVYEPEQAIKEPVESIKRALSRALVHYYPVSGRLALAGDGEAHIVCSGEGQGVQFVSASASCALKDAGRQLKSKDLALDKSCGDGDAALLMMQVTEFSCGGFVVGVTWNHGLADGAGMGQFLQAVGELARGMPAPSVAPARSLGPSPSPTWVAAAAAEYRKYRTTFQPAKDSMAFLDITIPWGCIARARAGGERPCTVFEAVAALLWQCRTRAAMSASGPEALTALAFSSNVRKLVGAADGYYGNCFVVQSAHAASGQVANGDAKDVAELIRRRKETIPDIFDGGGKGAEHRPLGYSRLVVVSWRNIGLDAADMGRGGPARVRWQVEHTSAPGCVVCPPCRGDKDGVNVMSMCVRQEHADAFLRELAALNFYSLHVN